MSAKALRNEIMRKRLLFKKLLMDLLLSVGQGRVRWIDSLMIVVG